MDIKEKLTILEKETNEVLKRIEEATQKNISNLKEQVGELFEQAKA